MGSNKDSGKPVSGEVIKTEDENMPTVGGIFSRLSRFPFFNFRQHKKIASVRKVVQEEEGLWNDLTKHRESFNRLKNVDHILEEQNATLKGNAAAARSRLAEEERKEAARKRDDLIFEQKKIFEEMQSRMRNEYELKIQEAEYKKKLHALKKEFADLEAKESQPPKKTRGPSTTALFREKGKVDKECAKRKAAIDASNDSAEKKKSDQDLLDRWREEQYERIEKQYGGVD